MLSPDKEYYTLQNAIEWIAFRKESENITADTLSKNNDKLKSAKDALALAIKNHKIHVVGQVVPKSRYDFFSLFNHPEYNQLPLEAEMEVDNLNGALKIYPESNELTIGKLLLKNIKILVKNLKIQFPSNIPPPPTDGYSTPYMKIMLEVIQEEKLSITNQSKKDVLTKIIESKMAAHGLNKSNKIAGVMATIIRLPSSQKGRNRKG